MERVSDFPDACLTHDQHLHPSGMFVLPAEPTSVCHHPPECRAVLVSGSQSTAEPLGAMFFGAPRNAVHGDDGWEGICSVIP